VNDGGGELVKTKGFIVHPTHKAQNKTDAGDVGNSTSSAPACRHIK